jgi:transposase
MSSINKQSVREESDRIKADMDRLIAQGKIDNESKMLMQSMLMLINLLIAVFMEKITKKNNKNSSMPSSQTEKDNSALSNHGTNGKGKQESDAIVNNTRTIETITVAKVEQCNICGQDLTNIQAESLERRTTIDVIFEKVVEHVDAEIKHCPGCDATVKGKFPANMHGPLQYGNGLKAFIINLLICQMVALNRVQKLVKSMIGAVISEATMLKFVMRLYYALETWEADATKQILLTLAMNVDETGFRVEKKNYWIHVYAAGDITLKFLHKSRGSIAINEINIIPRYGGVIIHDCWASYLMHDNCEHGLCGSHLLRELTYIVEANNYKWAIDMKELLRNVCKQVSKNEEKKLNDEDYAKLQKQYQAIIRSGETELPPIPPRTDGKCGKIAKSDAHNLWERLKEYETAVLLFAKNAHVSFTNNRAEQDLRMAKVKQKVSGCFRKELQAKAYCRISSYLQTMASKGYNPLIAIQMALASEDAKIGSK